MKLVSVPRDGIDRADRMDQGWKRVFEFEMEGYVLSLIVESTFTTLCLLLLSLPNLSSINRRLGKESFLSALD